MMMGQTLCCCALALLCSSAWAGDSAAKLLEYELQVFRLDGAFRSKTFLSPDIRRADERLLSALDDSITLFNKGEFIWGSETLRLDGKGCFWNGKKLTFEEGYREKLPDGKAKMIYSPSVIRPVGDLVRLKIESDSPVQYMQPRGDGLFELEKTTLPVGMDLEVKAIKNEKGGFRIEYFEVELRSVGSRETVPGIGLAVGKPRLKNWKYTLKFNVQPRKGYGILVRPEGTTGAMLIRLAVSHHKS